MYIYILKIDLYIYINIIYCNNVVINRRTTEYF